MKLPFLSRKLFFSRAEQQQIIETIRTSEKKTSGEIRVYVEKHCRYVETIDRAGEVFHTLKMEKTAARNGVLVYLATSDREVAVYGDQGIHEKVGDAFWNQAVAKMLARFSSEDVATGTAGLIREVGVALELHFPYQRDTDENELPDDIVFGR